MNMKEKMEGLIPELSFIKEEDYFGQMEQLVRPILEQNRKTGYFKSFDDARLYYECYENPQEKAAIVISHGFCEFTQKFEEVIFYFFRAGYTVYILDHRGHGYSERMVEDGGKVYIHSYEEYVQDFHSFITKIVVKENRHKKLVLYAHSMGGAIAALYLEQHPDIFSCAILSSPMLEMNFGMVPTAIVWFLLLLIKLLRIEKSYAPGHGGFDGIADFKRSSCLSEARYQHIFSKRQQDKQYQTYGASCAWALASLRALRKLHKQAGLIKTPILMFQAGRDTTVKSGGQLVFARKTENTKLVRLPESKHEIYNSGTEIITEYYTEIFAFLEEKLKG
jgi:lysophospholipase